jgi:hypothetical protein
MPGFEFGSLPTFSTRHLFTAFLFPSVEEGGSRLPLAHSVSGEASPMGFASEFERLAQRAPTETELAIALRVSDKRSVWAEGLRPEALALVAVALSSAMGLRILFVSASARVLAERQIRLGTRGPCRLLGERAVRRSPTPPTELEFPEKMGLTVWATTNDLRSARLERHFGESGPELVFIEDVHAASSETFAYRPSFARVKTLLSRIPNAQVVASSTPTDNKIKKRIGDFLGVRGWSTERGLKAALKTEATTVGNQHLSLRVERDEQLAIQALVGPLARPALVLCGTPAQADAVYAQLEDAQVPVHRFHSALPSSERARELVHFALPGRRAVMVAVSAFGPEDSLATELPQEGATLQAGASRMPETFGLGYARDDLRTLVHLCAPCSLAQYSQELGLLAAGHDERKTALLYFDVSHLALNAALLERKRPSVDHLGAILGKLLAQPKGARFDSALLAGALNCSPRQIASVLGYLFDAGALEREADGYRVAGTVVELKATAELLSKAFSELGEGDHARLLAVEAYATETACRGQTLARLLSLKVPVEPCGLCDHCAPEALSTEATESDGLVGVPVSKTHPGKRRTPFRLVKNAPEDQEDLYLEQDEAL